MSKKDDDLEVFLQSRVLDSKSEKKEKPKNLIKVAIEESEASKNSGGRPVKDETEKSTARLIGYVKPEQKKRFTEKRGAVAESKAIGLLVEKYINGEITL